MYKKNPVRFWMVADLYLTVEFAKTFMDFQTLTKQDKVRGEKDRVNDKFSLK